MLRSVSNKTSLRIKTKEFSEIYFTQATSNPVPIKNRIPPTPSHQEYPSPTLYEKTMLELLFYFHEKETTIIMSIVKLVVFL